MGAVIRGTPILLFRRLSLLLAGFCLLFSYPLQFVYAHRPLVVVQAIGFNVHIIPELGI